MVKGMFVCWSHFGGAGSKSREINVSSVLVGRPKTKSLGPHT